MIGEASDDHQPRQEGDTKMHARRDGTRDRMKKPVAAGAQARLTTFFAKKPAVDDTPTKRVKSVPPEAFPIDAPLRAPSPVSISPTKAKEIEMRKLEALQRMEAKRRARICQLEMQHLPSSWLAALEGEFSKPYFVRLKEFLQSEWDRNVKVFPPAERIYSWASFCPIDQIKVVVLGQDPYHNDGQATGLAFSVPRDLRPLPPSLQNIYKELKSEFPDSFSPPKHGSLEGWARQGVLLLNATLTVRAHEAASHANRGWELFTDQVIAHISNNCQHVVFVLWGNYAQKKGAAINKSRHLVLLAAHPSPLSASRGFFGCGHFRQANEYLVQHGVTPINWSQLDD